MAVALSHRVLQPTLQVAVAVLLTSLLTFIRPLNFSLACLSAVFVLVLHILLVQNFHVGTQLLSAASFLGTVWSGIAAAGIVVSITMQIPSRAGHIALLVVLASGGLALGCLVRVSIRQFPLLFLQGTNLLMTFGMSVVLSFWAPTVRVLWSSYLSHMLLAFLAAGLASIVVGLLVLPSLATAEAMRNVVTALNRAGQTSTMCVSILLAPLHLLGASKPGDPMQQQQKKKKDQDIYPAGADTDAAALRHDRQYLQQKVQQPSGQHALLPSPAPPPSPPQVQQQQQGPRTLQQQPSLLLEDPLSHGALSSIVEQANQPGQWGLRSFLAANSAAAAAATASAGAQDTKDPAQHSTSSAASVTAPAAGYASSSEKGSGSLVPAAPAGSTAAGLVAGSPTAATPAADDEDLWFGNDHYDDDHVSDIISADANVQVRSMPGASGHSISGARYTGDSSSSNGSSSGGGSVGPQTLQLATLAVGPAAGLSHTSASHTSGSQHSMVHTHTNQLHSSSSAPALDKHSNIISRSTSASTQTAPMQGGKGILPAISSRSSPNLNAPSLRMPLRPLSGLRKGRQSTAPTATGGAGKPSKDFTAGGSPAAELQRHPLVRLQRGVDQIRPLLQATRQLQAAVTVEQAWWVGMLVRYRPGKIVDAGAWQQLVDALEALVHRVAALESMLEGGHEHSSLAQLTSYQALAGTCGAVFAQAAALCGVVSTHLSTKLQQTEQQGDLLYALQQALKGICCGSSSRGSNSSGNSSGGAGAAAANDGLTGSSSSSSRFASRTAVHLGTLPTSAVPSSHFHSHTKIHSTPTTSSSSSSALSKHSPSSPALCSASTFDWDLAKQHLVQVLEYETHEYYTALVQAAHDRPFKLDPARSMTALMFLCMLSMGVIEACQKLQSAAQAVLGCAGDGSALGKEPGQQQQQLQSVHVGDKHKAAATTRADAPAAAPTAKARTGAPAAAAAPAGPSGTLLLLRTFLIVDVVLRIQDAFFNQLPAACKSRAAFKAQLKDRRFQAGFKAWLGSTIALVVIAAAYTQVTFLGAKGPSVFMFGFMSLVFTMRERVESSMEMVIFRVGATVVGACLGHLVMFNAATAYNPYIIGALNIFFALVFVPFSLGQFRLVVVLGLLTFASVTLCQYIGCCGGVGSVTYLVGRILATGGGALFAMLLNRLLWPWRRNRWAMEELSRALSIAVVSARMMYAAEYNQVAEAAPSAAPRPGAHSSNAGGIAAATVQRAASTPAAVVIELPVSSYGSSPSTAQQQGQAPVPSPETAKAPTPAASYDVPPALVGKSPEQLQQMLAGIMMPVQISIARDTWVTWKKGALALTPSVPLMLLAVQQMVDALSALGITYKLLSTMDQPSTTAGNTLSAGHVSSGGNQAAHSGSGGGASAEECVQWQRQLLLEELVQPIHGSFCRLLQELGTLVGLVLAHVRAPSDAGRTALLSKIQEVHDMRVSVSLEYIHMRNQRHRKMRQQLAAIWNSQQQHHAPGCAHAAHGKHAPHQQQLFPPGTSATHIPAAAGLQGSGFSTQSAATSGGDSAVGAGGQGCAAVVDGDCWCIQQPGFQHQVLSTVQYMAFVHALRRFFDRAVAVARVAADAQF